MSTSAEQIVVRPTADEVAERLGLTPNPSLNALAESADDPWRSILVDHRDATHPELRRIFESSLSPRGRVPERARPASLRRSTVITVSVAEGLSRNVFC